MADANNFFFHASSTRVTVIFLLDFEREEAFPFPFHFAGSTSVALITATSLDLCIGAESALVAFATATTYCPTDKSIASSLSLTNGFINPTRLCENDVPLGDLTLTRANTGQPRPKEYVHSS